MSKVFWKKKKKKFNLWWFTKCKWSSVFSSPSSLSPTNQYCNQFFSTSSSSSSSTSTFISNSKSNSNQDLFSSSEDYSESSPPDLSTLLSTQRFFFSFPGSSNSILDSLDIFPSLPEFDPVVTGGIAVSRYSPDPYMEFRRSMQEMVEARDGFKDVKECWDYLHTLLLCYLSLNPRSTHNLIVRAFSDLVVSFMSHHEMLLCGY